MTLRDKLKFWILLSNYIQMVVRGTSPLSLPDALDNKLLDLKAYGDCENRNLPEGYQELEYIEGNSANQYINTGIIPTSSMEYYAKCAVLDRIANSFPVFGARASNGGNDGVGAFVGSGANTRIDSFFFTEGGTEYRWQLDNVNTRGDIYEITFKNALQEIVKNGISIGTKQYTPTTTCDKPLYVGSLNNGGTLQAGEWTYRFYRFTITGIADMRPARRLSDGVLGMYDTIRKRFFTNAGTGSFIAGAALTLPEGYTRIEYIEGNNNLQYINTGIVPTSSMSMYFKGQFVSVDESTPTQVSFLAGARDVGGQYGFFLQLASTNVGLDWFVVNGRWAENHTRANGDIIEMRVNNSLAQMWLNGTSVGTHQYTPDDTTQYPLFLNGLNSVGQPFSNFNSINRIYRFTIDGVADFVPARRDSDGAIGMFNVLNNQFYGNAGTGIFTAGSDVVAPTPTAPQDIWCNNGAIKAIRPIKYLESTGTQYIDTGVVPKIGMKVEYEYSSPDIPSSNKFLFGSRSSGAVLTSTDQFYVAILNTAQEQLISGVDKTIIRDYQPNVDYTTTATNSSATANGTYNIILFGFNVIGTINCAGSKRIKSFKIYDNNTLIRDFIAALDANNIPCMFDKVEGKCYYNAGTGQFVAGYLPAEYEELEYIQGYTGNSSVDPSIKAAYIDTGIIFDTTLNMYYKGGVGGFNNNSILAFGARPSNAYSGISSYFSGADVVTDWGGTDSSGRWTLPLTLIAGDTFEVTTYNKIMTISKNGVVAGTNTFTGTATNNLSFYLNSRHDTNGVPSQSSPSVGRLYRFTVAGVCDMIPARKRSNGHIGMYDLVRRQFFESAGEGQFTVGKLPVLPDGYTQLEYLESTGTQYIDTGVKPNQDTSVELDGSIDGYGIFFGVRTAALVDISTIQGTSTGYWAMGYNTSADAFGSKDSNRHVWFKNKNLQYMDGVLKQNYTYANFTAMGNTYLFAYNNNGTVGYVINGRVRIYSCKIWATADSVLVRHLIPAKRNSDGVVGMYDIMNDVFLTNQGTGDFVYGSEIPTETFDGYYVDGDVEKVGTRSAGNKNLFNGIFEQGGLYQGNLVVADTRIRTPEYLTFPAGTYTISCASAYEVWIEKNDTSSVNWYSSYTFTASSTSKFKVAVRSKTDPSTTVIRPDAPVNVQIEAGSTATTYVPYCDGGLAVCENLLGIDAKQDVQELLAGDVTRNIRVLIFDGSEQWRKDASYPRFSLTLDFAIKSDGARKTHIYSTHFPDVHNGESWSGTPNNSIYVASSSSIHVKTTDWTTIAQWQAWLASQYNAGTPLIVILPIATADEESVTGQTLTVSAGNNTAEILQASIDGLEIEAKYLKVG